MRRQPRLPLRCETLEDRVTPALALDPSFGVGGRTFITPAPFPQYGQLQDAVARPDGKIWVLGAIGGNPVLARFNPNGELDRTFDGDGIEPILPWSSAITTFTLNKIALQADGRVVLAGTVTRTPSGSANSILPGPYYNSDTDLLAVRVNSDGTLDESFGDHGWAILDLSQAADYASASLFALRALADGRVMLAGNEYASNIIYAAANHPGSIPAVGSSVPRFVAARLTADGHLDTTYDGDGFAFVSPGDASTFTGGSGAVLVDGRVVFGAVRTTQYSWPAISPQEVYAAAYRLAADGSPDTTFAGDGSAETLIVSVALPADGSSTLYPTQQFVGVQPDGRVVVAVGVNSTTGAVEGFRSEQKLYAVRFTTGGVRDAAFGDNGSLLAANLTSTDTVYRNLSLFTVLPDGRLVTAVTTSQNGSADPQPEQTLALFTVDGRADITVTLPRPATRSELTTAFVVPVGDKLLLGGAADAAPNQVSRMGLVLLANDPPSVPSTADNQNRIGRIITQSGARQINLDPTFGGGAPVFLSTDLGPIAGYASAVVVDANGRSLVLGTVGSATVVARFNPDGTLDTTFDGDGVRVLLPTEPPGGSGWLSMSQLALQADGKILLVGTQSSQLSPTGPAEVRTLVQRLNADGSDDLAFGEAGVVLFGVLNAFSSETVLKVGSLANGQVVVVSWQFESVDGGSRVTVFVRRLNADGTPDLTFGTQGVATIAPPAATFDQIGGAAVLPDGSVVVAGIRQAGDAFTQSYVGVVRLTANGSLDTTFDVDGVAVAIVGQTTPGGSSYATAPLLAVQPNGAVVVGTQVTISTSDASGLNYIYHTDTRFVLVRFTPTGQRDATFGNQGTLTLDAVNSDTQSPTNEYHSYQSLLTLPDGRLSLLSTTGTNIYYPLPAASAPQADLSLPYPYPPGSQSVVVRRFTADGQTDLTFHTVILTAGNPRDALSQATQAVDAAGRVILAGNATNGLGIERLSKDTVSLPSTQPTVYVSGPNGTVEAFQRSADGQLVSAGTYTPFPGYTGPVRVVTADLNGDGFTDTVFATGSGGSRVRVQFGQDPANGNPPAPIDFNVFEDTFLGGVSLAVGDIDGDGKAELVVTPNAGGSGRVVVYSLADGTPVVRANFFGIDDVNFRGGATCALGDLDGDGKMELIIAAGLGGGPRVAVFTGRSAFAVTTGLHPPKLMGDFFAFPGPDATRLRNGVTVTAGDVNGDGAADLVFGGGPGGAPRVYTVDGRQLIAGTTVALANFFVAADTTTRDGVRLALKDLDGDGRMELIANASGTLCRAYNGTGIVQPNAAEPSLLDDFDSLASGSATTVFVG